MKGTGAAGEFNVAIGNYSLKTNSGSKNTAIGYKAGDYTNFTGDENVIIGYEADPVGVDAQNQIVIGYQATGQADNSVTLGNASVTKVYAAQDGEATIYASALTRAASSSGDDLSVSLTGAVDASILISSAGTGSDAISIDATAGSMVVAPTLVDGQTLKLGKNGAVEAIFSPHGTAAYEKFSLTNTAGTATDAIALTSTAGGITLASSTGLSVTGDTHTFTSANTTDPLVKIENTTNDANSSRLQFVKDKGAAGAANDVAGLIQFIADDASQQQVMFSEIKSQVKVATNGQEGGKFTISVAENDGTSTAGLVIEDGNADGELDVTIGSGTSSLVTIPGTLIVGSGAIISSPHAQSIYIGNTVTNTAAYNTGIGKNVFNALNNGTDNVAIGYDGLGSLTGGGGNVGIGANVLKSVTGGDGNVGVGYQAGYSITGDNNVTIGWFAGQGNSDGTAITSGSNNVIIGKSADASIAAASNQIVIGQGATGTGDNQIALGNTSITAIKGQVVFTEYSDKRIKREIRDSNLGLAFINKLRPVKYKLKNPADYPAELLEERFSSIPGSGPNNENVVRPEDNETIYNGLIAQEVKTTMDELNVEWSGWSKNESDGKEGIQYGKLTVPLIKAIQEQQEMIEFLREEIEILKSKMD
jgi:trimeric autotransporter adhesin